MTWPVGMRDFRGAVDRLGGDFIRFTCTACGSTEAPKRTGRPRPGRGRRGRPARRPRRLELLAGTEHDAELFLAGETTPMLFGSALTNFGVRLLPDTVIEQVPPTARLDAAGTLAARIPRSRDSCSRSRPTWTGPTAIASRSGSACRRFEQGMVVTHGRTGKPFATKYAHSVFGQERETLEEAFPGDVVGLVNATDVCAGDALRGAPVGVPRRSPASPEHWWWPAPPTSAKSKQFRTGIAQLDEEGVVQVLRTTRFGDQAPILAAVGPSSRSPPTASINEFGAPVELTPPGVPRGLSHRREASRADPAQVHGGRRRAARLRRHLLSRCSRGVLAGAPGGEHPELTRAPGRRRLRQRPPEPVPVAGMTRASMEAWATDDPGRIWPWSADRPH